MVDFRQYFSFRSQLYMMKSRTFINMQLLITKGLQFHYNPFSGVTDDDISNILIPKQEVVDLIDQFQPHSQLIIELVGKKGRGKTTHLRYLHQQLSSKYPLFLLNSNSLFENIIEHPSQIVLVDSIHYLSIFQRQKLYKNKRLVIFTTHHTKKWECKLAGRKIESIHFRGLDEFLLEKIIIRRLKMAMLEDKPEPVLNRPVLLQLLKKYRDDYRAIMNFLYDEFQTSERVI